MSVSSKRRSTLQLTGEPRLWHDPSNLPYEAVRKVWWSGFRTCVWILVVVAFVAIVIWTAVEEERAKTRQHPPQAPSLPGAAVPNPFGPDSEPGESGDASSGTEVQHGAQRKPPGALEPAASLPSVPPHPAQRDVASQVAVIAARERIDVRPAAGRVEWLRPVDRVLMVGVCRGIRG